MHANLSVFVPHLGCPCRCSFCDQRSISGTVHPPTAEEVRALCEEQLPHLISRYGPGNCQLAFFGGSFTAVDRTYMISLLEAAQPYIGANKLSGIRISTRPDAVSEDIAVLLKRYHVTAVELGCQSMFDDVLEKNGRGHTAQDTVRAAELLHRFGFSLGVQMMVGLPGDTDEKCLETAKILCRLSPDTVRIYPTVVLEHTPMAQWYRRGEFIPMDLSHCVQVCASLMDLFESHGIKVIRVGLHDGANLKKAYVAGPYHPAFRQLCASARIDGKVRQAAEKAVGTVVVKYPPRLHSDVVGQHKCNVEKWRSLECPVILQPDEDSGGLTITVKEQ